MTKEFKSFLILTKELYPKDYDMSIVFDTVENRKARHEMGRKYSEKTIIYENNDK